MKARGKQTSVFLSRRALSTAASRASVGPTAPQSGVAGFPKTPKKRNRYWADEDNQRRQLEQIAEKIGVNQVCIKAKEGTYTASALRLVWNLKKGH